MTKQVQYPYAYDENNNLVFVEDIEREHRHDHLYHCPGCGQSMLPRLGGINAKHFYHSEGQACGIESYIHATAKVIIANRFNAKEKPFKIGLTSGATCRLANVCKEDHDNCYTYPEYQEYDLVPYFQNATVEERFLTDSNQNKFLRHFKFLRCVLLRLDRVLFNNYILFLRGCQGGYRKKTEIDILSRSSQ